MGEVGSIKPNPYIFDIENRRKRKPRLAHDLGAGAKCKKCGDKCPGFELHFWRKICMNCRCGKDDHEIEDVEEDIGRIVIGKLFDRPARTEKEELEYCHGNDLEIVNEETGKAENVKFDWVPPNVEKTLASRYMELLPPEKRPIAGSEAAKERRRQLEQQLPLYDMDAGKRCDTLPPEELQNFQAYLERIRTQVAGQGTVQEIAGPSAPLLAQPFHSPVKPNTVPAGSLGGNLDANGNIGLYPDTLTGNEKLGHGTPDQANIQNNNVSLEGMPNYSMHGQPQSRRDSQSLRQQFLGGMVGDTVSFKAPESTAFSSPYGGTIMNAKGFPGIRNDKSVDGLSSGISDLSVQENLTGAIPGTETSALSHGAGYGQPGYKSNDQKKIPPAVAPKGYRPVRPGHLQQPSNQSGSLEHSGYQPGSGIPGYQPPEYQYDQSLNQGFKPDQPSYQPGESDYQTEQLNTQPGLPSNIQAGNYQQRPSEYAPKPPQFESEQSGYQQGHLGDHGDQIGSHPNYQQDPQSGFLPNQQGYLSPGEHQSKPYESVSPYQSDEQEFPAPPPELLAGYPSGYTGSEATSSDSGVEVYDNIGAKLRARLDEEGVRTPLQQMLAKERNIQSNEAMQAPYGAHLDTLTGGMSIAPGSDVNVLFPGESQLLGTPGRQSSSITGGHKSKYSCQGCSLPMNVGDVAIFCERAGEDKCWHPACFCCFTCKELLADLIYFYKDGKVFCGRHFTDAEEMPRCKACDELIFGNSWTRADGFDWHINHFCCNVCDTPMAGQRYVPDKNGYPYCLPCYMSYVAKMCEGCEEKISPEVNRCGHRGYFYHATPQCFKCYTCQEALLGKRFKMSKNWVFCSNECIQKAAEDLANNPNPKEKEEI